ncbi:uncharacterized protein [Spinacia oleracea]|uniref:RNase H type-1 domain-containing protein n=1 Tax=Spinacia oleracea TaxID=3562 RepID=A0ABM3RRV6_SPIOL|nr:uncharacterized protein LOC130471988 [Spinacia oleracea]
MWNACTLWVFEKKKVDPRVVVARTNNLLGEVIVAGKKEKLQEETGARDVQGWTPPPRGVDKAYLYRVYDNLSGVCKINTDAAVSVEGNIGLGMVVRDEVGDVLMSAGRNWSARITALQAEAEAMWFGLRYAYDASFINVQLESDCLVLVKLLQSRTKEESRTQVIVSDICNLVCSFLACAFKFAPRTCNKVAHAMAKVSLLFEEVLVWMEDCPSDICSLVMLYKALIE